MFGVFIALSAMLLWTGSENLCSNGDFEQGTGGWTVFQRPDGSAWVKLTEDAHSGKWAMELYCRDDKPVVLNRIYHAPDDPGSMIPLVRGVAEFRYKAISSEAEGNLIFYVIGMNDQLRECVRSKYVIPQEHIGDGRWHEGKVEFDFRKTEAKYIQIAPRINESPKRGAGRWIVDDIVVHKIPARLEVVGFGFGRPLYRVGERGVIRCEVRNSGDEMLRGAVISLLTDEKIEVEDEPSFQLDPIAPDGEAEIQWRFLAQKPGIARVDLRIEGSGAEFARKLILPIVEPTDEEVMELEGFRLRFFKSSYGFTHFEVEGEEKLGIGLLVGELRYRRDGEETVKPLIPTDLRKEGDRWSFEGDGYRCSFARASDGPFLDVECSITPVDAKEDELVMAVGPRMFWGEGAFGARKSEGLLPGLEWLVDDERSSSELDAIPGDRFLPHPSRVTIPLMAICTPGKSPQPIPLRSYDPPLPEGHYLVGVMWNPKQRWDGDHDRPAPFFASPNFLDGQRNHLMALLIPSPPEYIPENLRGQPKRGYRISPGQEFNLEMTIFVERDAPLLKSVDYYLKRFGLPPLPEMPYSFEEGVDECVISLRDVLWDDEKKGWHMALHDPWGPHPNPDVILNLMIADKARGGYGEKLSRQIEEALLKVRSGGNFELAFLIDDIGPVVSRGRVKGLIRKMDNEGGYYFQPDEKHEKLGIRGYTTLGDCARPLLGILKYARITGDEGALRAAFKGLRFIERFNVPRGAQTWEVPLHTPDVLASAFGVRIYLEAYRITGERRYLDKAIYWAKTGLPFIYLWNADDQPIMLYGSIPVFGGTWYTGLWFGRLVQWCGLDYAYSLLLLSKYDETLPWRRVAKGITVSAMQQQDWTSKDDPSHRGMYPDAFDVTIGEPPYKWDLSPVKILRNLLTILGYDQEISTVVRDGIRVSGVTPIERVSVTGGEISIRLGRSLIGTSHLLVIGVGQPSRVSKEGDMLREAEDLASVAEGWKVIGGNRLIVKVQHRSPTDLSIGLPGSAGEGR
jgi:hypothetical protein